MSNISAVIVANDNPPYLFNAIDSIIDIATEILLFDIGLENQILLKLKNYNKVKSIKITEPVPYVEMIRQKSIDLCSHNYILIIDPDEIFPPSLKNHLLKIYPKYDYIKIPRKNIIFRKWIRHSRWWPDYQVRLFKKKSVNWPNKLHAQPEVSGESLSLPADEKYAILHYNYVTIDDFLQKAIRYAKSEANQKKNIDLNLAVKESLNELTSRYFRAEGYQDETRGLSLAILQMFYPLLVYLYSMEAKNFPQEDRNKIMIAIELFFKKGLYDVGYWLDKKKLVTQKFNIRKKILQLMLQRL